MRVSKFMRPGQISRERPAGASSLARRGELEFNMNLLGPRIRQRADESRCGRRWSAGARKTWEVLEAWEVQARRVCALNARGRL